MQLSREVEDLNTRNNNTEESRSSGMCRDVCFSVTHLRHVLGATNCLPRISVRCLGCTGSEDEQSSSSSDSSSNTTDSTKTSVPTTTDTSMRKRKRDEAQDECSREVSNFYKQYAETVKLNEPVGDFKELK